MSRFLTKSHLMAAIAVMVTTGSAQANLLINGSFEMGSNPSNAPSIVVNTGDNTTLTGWTVGGPVGVDWVQNNYWQSQDGKYSLDMNALGAGAITQTFATTPGATYTASYYLSLNPDTNPTFPTDRSLLVSATNAADSTVVGTNTYTFPFNSVGSTYTNMNWQQYSTTFTATGDTTTLSFASLNSGAGGVALDNVSVDFVSGPVNPVPAPAGLILGLLGAAVGIRFRRRKASV